MADINNNEIEPSTAPQPDRWQPGESTSGAAALASAVSGDSSGWAGAVSESGSSQLKKRAKFQTPNYKNGFLVVPPERWQPAESAAAAPASGGSSGGESASAAVSGGSSRRAGAASESASPKFKERSKFQTRNYKNGFMAVPVEVERIGIGDFNASGSVAKIRKCKTLATTLQKKDGFSVLPSEVVSIILSRLSFKDVVRTSILSRSWKDLWKGYSGCLDFDAPNLLPLALYFPRSDIYYDAACMYTRCVENVLNTYQYETCKGLRIAFHLNYQFSAPIDRWIEFAISKDVESLVLDLSHLDQYPNRYSRFHKLYAFPAWLMYEPCIFQPFDRLTCLELGYVRVQDEVMHYITGNCRLLQRLSLKEIFHMENLRIDNSLPELKELEISICPDLVNVYVSARLLTSFKYNSDRMERAKTVFGDVPELSLLVLGGNRYHVVLDNLPFNLSRLNCVSLNVDAPVCLSQEVSVSTVWSRDLNVQPLFRNPQGSLLGGKTSCFGTLRKFLELKQLELNIKARVGDVILCSGTFLHASTCLEKLVLKLTWTNRRWDPSKMKHVCPGCKHKCLKELVYVGWLGLDAEVEIVERLIECAESTLERITINLCHSHSDRDAVKLETSLEKDNAMARAMKLQQKLVSTNVKLMIIG